MKEMLKYGFILGVICILAGGILSGVHALTQPQIQKQGQEEERLAMQKVLPQAADFRPQEKAGELLYFRALDSQGKLCGFVLKVARQGYSSEIAALAGLDLQLQISQVLVVSQNETPGLGSRVTEKDFLGQFKGRSLDSLGQVQAIAGASISSRALIQAIQDKLKQVQPDLLQEIDHAR